MKRIIFLSFLILNVYLVNAQVFTINNCISITSYLANKNDTLVIGCDSVYLLNKKTFSVYQLAYEKWKGRDISIRQAFNTYESLVTLQGKRIEQQELEYNRLKLQFDSLALSSVTFIGKTGNRLGELNESLNTVNANLNKALDQINESQELLKEERKKKIKNAITWGVGGLTLGLITGLLIN